MTFACIAQQMRVVAQVANRPDEAAKLLDTMANQVASR
jgi:hypothetical protein